MTTSRCKDNLPGAKIWGSLVTSHRAPAHYPPSCHLQMFTMFSHDFHIIINNQDYPGLNLFKWHLLMK